MSQLPRLIREYVGSALTYLRSQTSSPTHVVETYKFEESSARLIKLRRVSTEPLIQIHADALAKLPEIEPLAQAMPDRLKGRAGRYAVAVVQSYLRGRSDWRYDAKAVSRHAEAYARMWSTGYFELFSLYLLSGVDLERSSLQLDEGVKLVPISDAQRGRLFGFSPENDLGMSELMAIKASLVVKTRHSLEEMERDYGRLLVGYHSESLQRSLTALQLASSGLPRHQRTYTWFEPQPLWYVSGAGQTSVHRYTAHRACPPLSRSERRRTRELFLSLSNKRTATLDVARRRLSASYEERAPEDVVVDLVIALEVTLSSGAKSDSVTRQLQLRALALVGDVYPEIDSELSMLYATRGKIVHHGADVQQALAASGSSARAELAVSEARERVRTVLSRHLELVVARQIAPGELNAEIDSSIRAEVARSADAIRQRIKSSSAKRKRRAPTSMLTLPN